MTSGQVEVLGAPEEGRDEAKVGRVKGTWSWLLVAFCIDFLIFLTAEEQDSFYPTRVAKYGTFTCNLEQQWSDSEW